MPDPKRPGRPSIDPDGSTPVNVRVPSTDYDRAAALAQRQQISVSEFIRRGLKRALEDDE